MALTLPKTPISHSALLAVARRSALLAVARRSALLAVARRSALLAVARHSALLAVARRSALLCRRAAQRSPLPSGAWRPRGEECYGASQRACHEPTPWGARR